MSDQARVNRVVILEGDLVKTRCVRRNAAPPKYAPLLQDLFLLGGDTREERMAAIRSIGMKYYHGFIRR